MIDLNYETTKDKAWGWHLYAHIKVKDKDMQLERSKSDLFWRLRVPFYRDPQINMRVP